MVVVLRLVLCALELLPREIRGGEEQLDRDIA